MWLREGNPSLLSSTQARKMLTWQCLGLPTIGNHENHLFTGLHNLERSRFFLWRNTCRIHGLKMRFF